MASFHIFQVKYGIEQLAWLAELSANQTHPVNNVTYYSAYIPYKQNKPQLFYPA